MMETRTLTSDDVLVIAQASWKVKRLLWLLQFMNMPVPERFLFKTELSETLPSTTLYTVPFVIHGQIGDPFTFSLVNRDWNEPIVTITKEKTGFTPVKVGSQCTVSGEREEIIIADCLDLDEELLRVALLAHDKKLIHQDSVDSIRAALVLPGE